MKHYRVIYYDGSGEKGLFVRAKSLNDAIQHGKQALRLNKVIGATIRRAEHITKVDYLNGLDASVLQLKHRQIGHDRLMNAYQEMVEACDWERTTRAQRTKHQPLKANQIVNIIKKGK